jgi:two-component system LytT family response regulator
MNLPAPPPLRLMLVDDEPLSSRLMSEMLSHHAEVSVVAIAETAEDALRLGQEHKPDVVFLDIQLGGCHGFSLLPCLASLNPAPLIVFVTAFEEHAVAAFKEDTLDYLLKPVHPDRLSLTILRLSRAASLSRSQTPAPPQPAAAAEEGALCRLSPNDVEVLRDGRSVFLLKPHQIQAVQAEGAYTRVLFATDQSCMVKRGIGYWEKRLPEGLLLKASRSLLLNPKCVIKIKARSRSETDFFLEGRSAPLTLSRLESLRIRQAV